MNFSRPCAPNVIKAGVGIDGECGEGALLVAGKTSACCSIASALIGFQLGTQARSQIVGLVISEHVEALIALDRQFMSEYA